MLVLFETSGGFALFKVLKEGRINEAQDLSKDFENVESASQVVKLKAFKKFADTAEALQASAAVVDGKLSKPLRKFLKKQFGEESKETLGVADAKLGGIIKDKLGIPCVYSNGINELMRGLRLLMSELIEGLSKEGLKSMSLGLSHSLSRYKLKFSPDKVDTMIIQAIGLLDELDKELNTYAMRVREWYGWHFPEMTKIVADNMEYAKAVKFMTTREKASDLDFSGILVEEVENALKEAAIISMGTEISEGDMMNICALCDQVIALSEYRAQLYDYLKARMQAIAPNLTILVGELVGARLIAHAGSLMNLAKHPASTVQILGAEKALFRALKTKHETPKYGLIYHASLVGQSAPKFKGKISRVLAAKCALAIRVDALGETPDSSIGLESRAKVEERLLQLEGKVGARLASQGKPVLNQQKYDKDANGSASLAAEPTSYSASADVTRTVETKKAAAESESVEGTPSKQKKKKKKKKSEAEAGMDVEDKPEGGKAETDDAEKSAKKAKKKERYFGDDKVNGKGESSEKKKKRKVEDTEKPKKKKKAKTEE